MPDDIPDRVAALEREVVRMRAQLAETTTDAKAARLPAAGADHDVSEVRAELRAHTRAISALRETQVDTGREIDRLRQETRRGFEETHRKFDLVNEGLVRIVTLIERDR